MRPRSDDQDLNICENLYAEGNATVGAILGLRPRAARGRGRGLRDRPADRGADRATRSPASTSIPRRDRSRPPTATRCSSPTVCGTACTRCSPGPDGVPKPRARDRLRAGCRERDRHRGRAQRRPALRRPGRRRAPHRMDGQRVEPAPTVVVSADTLTGSSAADGQLHLDGHERPRRRRPADLRVGPRRRRRVRRRKPGERHAHLSRGRSTHGHPARHRHVRGDSATDSLTIHVGEPAQLTTLTFSPSADARVEEANPATNFGTSIKLQATASMPSRESYLRFQLAGHHGSCGEREAAPDLDHRRDEGRPGALFGRRCLDRDAGSPGPTAPRTPRRR